MRLPTIERTERVVRDRDVRALLRIAGAGENAAPYECQTAECDGVRADLECNDAWRDVQGRVAWVHAWQTGALPCVSLQEAVVERVGVVRGAHGRARLAIGDCARQATNTIDRPGGQRQTLHRATHDPMPFGVELRRASELRIGQT